MPDIIIFRGDDMVFSIKEYDFENLVDEGRQLVIDELGRQLADYPAEICKCGDCVLDMAAMALNALPSRYRCSLLGTLYQKAAVEDPKYSGKLRHAVRVAIERVGSNPAHD